MLKTLRIAPGNGATFSHPLGDDPISIGRSPSNTLAFPELSALSRQHASIQKRGTRWFVVDLGSANGVLVNGMQVRDESPLASGDHIAIGSLDIWCLADDEAAAETSALGLSEPSPRDAPLHPGAIRGRHTVFQLQDSTPFAYGRASALFRALAATGEIVCIKVFHRVHGDSWDGIRAFEREVVAQRQLTHPHILPVLDYGLSSGPNGSPFVALPYCAGGNLRELLLQRRYAPLNLALPLLHQAAEALDLTHASGFVHGDVKPENLLLSADRRDLFLSDFGMSNVFALEERFSTVVEGPRGGTTAYLSPEQISSKQQTPLSDIYAFALVAYELLTGKLPYDTSLPPFKQMLAKVEGKLIDPQTFNPSIGDAQRAVLMAGLDVDPLRRPRSAVALYTALAEGASVAITVPNEPMAAPGGSKVFVSYSHKDAEWLDRIQAHLKPLSRMGVIDVWDDRRIRAGDRWRDEIVEALHAARCAVLLVSADFLASDFCIEAELPTLLRRAQERGVRVLTVLVSPCQLGTVAGLDSLQAVNAPSRTLVEMDVGERERTLVALAAAVLDATTSR